MLFIVYHVSRDVIGYEDSNLLLLVRFDPSIFTVEQSFTVSLIVGYPQASSPFPVASKASRETIRERER